VPQGSLAHADRSIEEDHMALQPVGAHTARLAGPS
jgi:hypothetical protein